MLKQVGMEVVIQFASGAICYGLPSEFTAVWMWSFRQQLTGLDRSDAGLHASPSSEVQQLTLLQRLRASVWAVPHSTAAVCCSAFGPQWMTPLAAAPSGLSQISVSDSIVLAQRE